MAEHANANTIRRFFAAHAANDLETLVEVIAEDAVWHLPCGGTRLSEDATVRGLGALAVMSAKNLEASDGTFRFDIQSVFAGPTFAAVVSHNTATAGDRLLDLHVVIQFRLDNGKIAEVWESPDDIDAYLDFWSKS
jgi:ketosteroid isomerase-like protein